MLCVVCCVLCVVCCVLCAVCCVLCGICSALRDVCCVMSDVCGVHCVCYVCFMYYVRSGLCVVFYLLVVCALCATRFSSACMILWVWGGAVCCAVFCVLCAACYVLCAACCVMCAV